MRGWGQVSRPAPLIVNQKQCVLPLGGSERDAERFVVDGARGCEPVVRCSFTEDRLDLYFVQRFIALLVNSLRLHSRREQLHGADAVSSSRCQQLECVVRFESKTSTEPVTDYLRTGEQIVKIVPPTSPAILRDGVKGRERDSGRPARQFKPRLLSCQGIRASSARPIGDPLAIHPYGQIAHHATFVAGRAGPTGAVRSTRALSTVHFRQA
jgi:hypothetical protein